MRNVLTPEIVDDFLHDPQTTHILRGIRHKDSWDQALDRRDADTAAAIKELLAMWQDEHPLKVGRYGVAALNQFRNGDGKFFFIKCSHNNLLYVQSAGAGG